MAEILFGEPGAGVMVLSNHLNTFEGTICYPPTETNPKFRIAVKTQPMSSYSDANEKMYVELMFGLGKVSDGLLDPIPVEKSVKDSKCWFYLGFGHRES